MCLGVKDHLEPLAVTANVTQSDNACLDTVVLTLINLYRIYSDTTRNFDETFAQAILVSLEKRWAKADLHCCAPPQPICSVCFARNSPYLSFALLWKFVRDAYQRLFKMNVEPDHDFCAVFVEYLNRTGDWSDEGMSLEYHRAAAAKEFGVKHSKLRNRIHPEKVRKEVLVKTNTLAKLDPPPRRKRAFGDDDGEEVIEALMPTNNHAESVHDPLNFTAIANEMLYIQDLPHPIKLLFHYPPASDSNSASFRALTERWRAGEQGFETELEYHNFPDKHITDRWAPRDLGDITKPAA
ncbi:hypothetical protein DXG03_008841 [Asterophora parasitica]|uniref:Uncharacterized protein n=1 Tax=Asterophora parasitica TaxID=117018 RepID=A0A9P7K6P9_9AGAR|nr:hypothetical protein DXG03_008841 [Asterophora parasitica]